MKPTNDSDLKCPIFVNVATGMKEWFLIRPNEQLQVVGAVLTLLFLTAHEAGWSPRDLFSVDGDMTQLNLKDFSFSDREARDLSIAIASKIKKVEDDNSKEFAMIQSVIAFVASGAFRIERSTPASLVGQTSKKGFAGLSSIASGHDESAGDPSVGSPQSSSPIQAATPAPRYEARSADTNDGFSSEAPKKPTFSNGQIGLAFIGLLVVFFLIASMSSGGGNSITNPNAAASSSLAPPESQFLAVAAASANLREKPTPRSRQLKVLHFGDRLEYLNVSDTFTQVKLADSTIGYMASELLIPSKDFDRLRTLTARQYIDLREPEKRIAALVAQTQPMRDTYIEAITAIATRSVDIKVHLQTLEDFPRIVVAPDKSAGALYSLAARSSANAGKVEEAFWSARAAVEADPVNPDYHVALALASYHGGNMDSVKASGDLLPILAPKATNAWMILGLAVAADESENKFDEVAVGSFILAIKLSKNPVVTRKYFNDLIDKSTQPKVRKLLTDALAEEASNESVFGY